MSLGLSILIPVYNFDVTSLVRSLAEQLQQSGREGEIILVDDFSNPSFDTNNRKLTENSFLKYYRNEKNEGRTQSRRKLSSLAKFDHLLFIDCDSRIIRNNFIETYFEEAGKGIDISAGGRVYPSTVPAECRYRLHWKYGRRRESGKRAAFMSNNFLIRKPLFEQLDTS